MKRGYLLLLTAPLVFTSCAQSGVKHHVSEYMMSMNYKDDFRILQLTDLHLGDKDDLDLHFRFMDLTVKDANADLIVVTGDLFTFAGRNTARKVFDKLNSYQIPWTVTWGNHDEQCMFSVDWLTECLNNYGSYCLFRDIQDDDVTGNANFVINLMQGSTIFEQVIVMDSNRYAFGSNSGYDFIKEDQMIWYSEVVNFTKEFNGGTVVPSLLFAHIPVPEINDAWNEACVDQSKLIGGKKGENCCPPEYNSGFFQQMLMLGSTRALFYGHDHKNDFTVTYKGIDISYGVKSNDRVYYDPDMLGGKVVTIKNDHSLEYEWIYHHYEEVL